MLARPKISKYALCFLIAFPAIAAGPQVAVDRGMPQANLNNVSGAARSNVRWAIPGDGFLGDDFTVGAPGEQWVIDGIRTWTVPATGGTDPLHLGDFYQDVRLYFGGPAANLTPVATAFLSAGSNQTSSPNVQLSEASGNQTVLYDEFGKFLRVWQVDFTNLALPVDGGVKYRFGVWGMGRPVPGKDGKTYMWFNHASNAPLSGAPQDGSDGVILQFDSGGRAQGEFHAQGNGWDKSGDINVQVFAHKVSSQTASQ